MKPIICEAISKLNKEGNMKKYPQSGEEFKLQIRDGDRIWLEAILADITDSSVEKAALIKNLFDDIFESQRDYLRGQIAGPLHIIDFLNRRNEKLPVQHFIKAGYEIFLRRYYQSLVGMLILTVAAGKKGGINNYSELTLFFGAEAKIFFLWDLYSSMAHDFNASERSLISHAMTWGSELPYGGYTFLKLASTYWVMEKRGPIIAQAIFIVLPNMLAKIVLSYCDKLDQSKTLPEIEGALTEEEVDKDERQAMDRLFANSQPGKTPSPRLQQRIKSACNEALPVSLGPGSKLLVPSLIVATAIGAPELVQHLLKKKADPTVHFGGNCAFMWALQGRQPGHQKVAELLLNSIKPSQS